MPAPHPADFRQRAVSLAKAGRMQDGPRAQSTRQRWQQIHALLKSVGVVLAGLTKEQMAARAKHVREVLTGDPSGGPGPAAGLLGARMLAKAAAVAGDRLPAAGGTGQRLQRGARQRQGPPVDRRTSAGCLRSAPPVPARRVSDLGYQDLDVWTPSAFG